MTAGKHCLSFVTGLWREQRTELESKAQYDNQTNARYQNVRRVRISGPFLSGLRGQEVQWVPEDLERPIVKETVGFPVPEAESPEELEFLF